MGRMSLTKDELAMISNMPKYLEQICDAQNYILSQQSSVENYISNKNIALSNDSIEISKVQSSINANLLIINEIKQLTIAINDDIDKLWSSFNKKDETQMKYLYNRLKSTIKTYTQYVDTNKQTQIYNNTIIHRFLKKADLQQKMHVADIQLKKAKHTKIYQSKVLLITEKKIFLPYKDEDVQRLINSNSENPVDELITKKFVITNVRPYKSSSSHRFTQAYKLSKTKDKHSLIQAIKFALKVARIKNLHPAIIHACSSEDQLENYIMFLNQGNPSAFTDFEVRFQINPI